MQPDFEAAERRALELDGRVPDEVRAPESDDVELDAATGRSTTETLEQKVAQHKIAGTFGAVTGAITGTLMAGPAGTVVGAATGAARGVILGEVVDRVKEHMHDVESVLDPD